MAAVARAVGTPGVQRVGYPCLLPAVPLHRDRTGGMPLPPPRHPAASFRRSPVQWAGGGTRAGWPEHPLRRFGGSSGARGVGWGTLEQCCAEAALRRARPCVSRPRSYRGHWWLRRCRGRASPLSVRQRLTCFGRPLPGSGPPHGPACGGRGRWAWLLEHRCCQFERRAVRRFRRFCRGAPGSDFNLSEQRIREFRGRVVSRPRPFNNGRGYRRGYSSSRFTGLLAAPAITCGGCNTMIFLGFLLE